ncbi:MAG TPA: type III pantothenate kinase [Candidatus Limnocylindria bacterium]|nr:type III pantothenate kinase [Candidatus Limnocylindria bacterium]
MLLLVDIGNTHTHVGLGDRRKVRPLFDLPTSGWETGANRRELQDLAGRTELTGACFCSVVPKASVCAIGVLRDLVGGAALQLTPDTLRGVAIKYPRPETIGQDRLANAVAVSHHFGKPAVVVDFGTAVTFDVVDRSGAYVGGIIAPGLAAMTDYLHEKTALLPKIEITEPRGIIGKNTAQAMLIGAVRGYRGLVRSLILELKAELKAKTLPVVATGGYAALIARRLPEITAVRPGLTLEGLRLTAIAHGL